jgi:triacylglycerol lipase
VQSERLIDAQLLGILQQMPSLETTADTLQVMRDALSAWKLPAPEAAEVACEERFIETGVGRHIRILVYTPKVATPTGGLLWIHGGGMVMGAPEMNDAPNRYLAQQAGCIVIAIAYRLAPEEPYPAGLEDCYEVFQWMDKQAPTLCIPRDRIAVAGESGGGALCAGLSLLARDRGNTPPSAQFLMFPMLDDRTGTSVDPTPMPFSGEFAWHRSSNRFCWDAVLGNSVTESAVPGYASPGRAETLSGLPPTFLSVGDVDLFIGEDLRFAQQLIRDGVSTELHVYPGAAHGFTAWGADTKIAQRCQQEFWDAIVRHFRPNRD